jgi:hypothetical protein
MTPDTNRHRVKVKNPVTGPVVAQKGGGRVEVFFGRLEILFQDLGARRG